MKNIFVSLICQYNLPIMKELLYLKDDQLKDLIEKLFVSYRETFSDSKKILDRYSSGLAHDKVIHLLSMYEGISISELLKSCLLYTSDAADEGLGVDLGGRRIIK